MNVILVLLDSLNRHYLPCYGNDWVQAPGIQRLADRGVVFDNHFISSAPCMPARREMMTGRREHLWRGWGQIEPFDAHIADAARQAGAYPALITDHYHYWDRMNGLGYSQPFSYCEMIRGQEGDSVGVPLPPGEEVPGWVKAVAKYRGPHGAANYYRKARFWKDEEDFPSPRTMRAACEWLQQNAHLPSFFLMVECFDPHEPWHIPEPYRSMYGPYDEDITCWPPYQGEAPSKRFFSEAGEKELEHIRRQYAGKLTMVDRHLTRLWDTMDRQDLWDDTVVILTTDHGHEMGERGRFGKSYPHWNTNAHIPLIIWDPRHPGEGRRSSTFSCTVDIYATALDALGYQDISCPDGRSLMPAVADPNHQVRDSVLYGTFHQGSCLVNSEYTYFAGYDNTRHPVYWYSTQLPSALIRGPVRQASEAGPFMLGVDYPVWRSPIEWYLVDSPAMQPEQLFRFGEDHGQEEDIIAADPNGRRLCREQMIELMRQGSAAPPEQFARMGLLT